MIVSGLMHFDKSLIFRFPKMPFTSIGKFLFGLGTAMGIAMYDYLGYYDVCYIGDEVQHPEKNIPRSILISVVAVAAIYMTMNISFIGVIPWQEVIGMYTPNDAGAIGTAFVERLYGRATRRLCLRCSSSSQAFASIFAMFLGYSRIPMPPPATERFFSFQPFAPYSEISGSFATGGRRGDDVRQPVDLEERHYRDSYLPHPRPIPGPKTPVWCSTAEGPAGRSRFACGSTRFPAGIAFLGSGCSFSRLPVGCSCWPA